MPNPTGKLDKTTVLAATGLSSKLMLLCSSTGQACDEQRVELAGDVALDAPLDFTAAKPFCGATGGVGAGPGIAAQADHGHGVQGAVGLPVTAPVEPVSVRFARGSGYRTDPTQRSETGFMTELVGVAAGRYEQCSGHVGTDAEPLEQRGLSLRGELGNRGVEIGDLLG
jgi:hypothetical protein